MNNIFSKDDHKFSKDDHKFSSSTDIAFQLTMSLNKTPVKDIISKLLFIAKIQPGEKINVKEMFVRDNSSILQRFLRSMRNLTSEGAESKEATLSFIENTTDEALDLICTYKADTENEYKKTLAIILIKNLENSKRGIRNLFKTYEYDRIFVSRATAILQTLDARIKTHRLDTAVQPNFEDVYRRRDSQESIHTEHSMEYSS